jgi:hypothetical protein
MFLINKAVMNTIEDEWKKYKYLSLPVDASDRMLFLQKSAFYSGAYSLCKMQADYFDSENYSEEDYAALLGSWLNELKFYSENL